MTGNGSPKTRTHNERQRRTSSRSSSRTKTSVARVKHATEICSPNMREAPRNRYAAARRFS